MHRTFEARLTTDVRWALPLYEVLASRLTKSPWDTVSSTAGTSMSPVAMHLVRDRAKIWRRKGWLRNTWSAEEATQSCVHLHPEPGDCCLGSRAAAAGPDVDFRLCFHGCKPTGISRQDKAQRWEPEHVRQMVNPEVAEFIFTAPLQKIQKVFEVQRQKCTHQHDSPGAQTH